MNVAFSPVFGALCFCMLAVADARAGGVFDQYTLRQAIARGEVLPFSSLVGAVEIRLKGRLLNVVLIDEGGLFYRVLIKQQDGRIVSAVFDAKTGEILPVSSPRAQAVQRVARAYRAGDDAPDTSTPSAPLAQPPSSGAGDTGGDTAGGKPSGGVGRQGKGASQGRP